MSDPILTIIEKLPIEGVFDLTNIISISSDALDQLSQWEKHELDQCRNLKRQREFVSSRVALKQLAQKIKVGQEFEILKDELGQPFGSAGDRKYYVSIAHTDEQVFCGLSANHPIGVDLEPADREVSERLKQRIIHPQEKTLLDNISAIRLWTIKEAYIKLRGKGLRMNMNEVLIEQLDKQIFGELNNDKRAKICSFRMKNNWLAIAYYQK